MTRFIKVIIILAALLIAGYFILRARGVEGEIITITFTEAEIQEKIGRKFPKKERILEVFPLVIQEPQVKFLGERNRIQLTTTATLEIPFARAQELTMVASSSLRYEDEDKTLRVSEITVEEFETNGLKKVYAEASRLALTLVARKELEDTVVYTLEPEDYKKIISRMLIRKIRIKEGRLEVILGL